MTLRDFLDAAYVLIVDDQRRQGVGLLQALDDNELWRAGGPDEEREESENGRGVPPAVESKIERENTLALSELQRLMSDTGFSGGRT